MVYTREDTHLYDFQAWAGGKDHLEGLMNHCRAIDNWDAYDYIENWLDEYTTCCVDEPVSETDINDILWFEMDELLKDGGYLDENYEWVAKED